MSWKSFLRIVSIAAIAGAIPASAAKQARGYSHGFDKGNLIPNWSFEAIGQTWDPSAKTPGFNLDPRFKMSSLGGSNKAVSGSFASKVAGYSTQANAGGNLNLATPYFPMRVTTYYYTISFYVKASGVQGNVRPTIRLYRENGNAASYIESYEAARYENTGDWTLVTFQFYPGWQANYFRLVLAESNALNDGGTFYFDDIVVEEWSMTPRSRVREEIEFADAFGRPFQGQSYSSGSRVSAFPGWGNSGRIRINTTSTGANIKSNLENFPVLVRLGSYNFNFGEAQDWGTDLRFTDAAGNTITHSVEFWNKASNIAAIWVNVPKIEGNRADNDIFMYWGSPTNDPGQNSRAVFNEYAGFNTVYHLDNIPFDGFMENASSDKHRGSAVNMDQSQLVAGHIGYGFSFDGVNDYIEADMNPPEATQSLTFSAWIKPGALVAPNTRMKLFNQFDGYDASCYGVTRQAWIEGGKINFAAAYNGSAKGQWTSNQVLNMNGSTFYHVAIVFDDQSISSAPVIYVNGAATSLTQVSVRGGWGPESIDGVMNVGSSCLYPTTEHYHGVMDEFRYESRARAKDWVKFAYETEKNGSTVVTLTRSIKADQPTRTQEGGVAYDKFGRPDRSYLPCQSTSGDIVDPATCPADPDMPSMGGYNYAQAVYANQPGGPETEIGFPGVNNRVGSGHSAKSDYYYVANLNIPVNIETPLAATAADTLYRLSWSKDPDGNYSLSWQNRKGQVLQTASNVTRDETKTPDQWSWSKSQNDYYVNGSLKRARTPLDVANANTSLSLVKAFDVSGRVRGSFDPDRGLVRNWYNRKGQIRFTQDQGQRAGSGYTFFDYDAQGRLISKGSQSLTEALTQSMADQDAVQSGTKSEKIGYLFDNLSTFATRTGVSLATIMPDNYNLKQDFLEGRHAFGRMTCKYHKNNETPIPGFGVADKLVAEFYLYERNGSLGHVYKYFGPMRTAAMRYQEVAYQYDDAGRLVSESIYKNALDGTLSSNHGYEYDERGRLKRVTGGYGSEYIVELAYMGWGPVKSVLLGGDGSGTKGTKVEYTYHTLGGIQEIRATQLSTGKIIFQEFLGYDGKANGNAKVPANKPRYSGLITQQLYKFADDLNSQRPVRVVNYEFDELGRLLTADFQRNGSGNPLNTDGSINFNGFTAFENVADNDTRMTYDLNGRIKTNATDGTPVTATYNYKSNSYKLDNVSGRLSASSTRDMAAGGTFVYNNRGALTNDKSKDVKIDYDWNLMPTRLTKDATRNPGYYFEQYCFYDANGRRVSSINMSVSGTSRSWWYGKHQVAIGGQQYKEYQEQYVGTSSDISYGVETVNLFGAGVVGRKNRGDTEYFLYDHLGSLRVTVDANGNAPSSGRVANDYLVYGDKRKLMDNGAGEPITPAFTGKEYEDIYSLYYFGSRFYDPELGVWLSPDPARQFMNPYAYGKNPNGSIDADGEWIHIAVGAVIGTAVGVYTSVKTGHPIWSGATLTYALGGAASGALTAATAGLAAPMISGAVGTAALGVGASAAVAGFTGTVIGGAATGALSGAISYSLNVGIGMKVGDIKGMSSEQFWTGMAFSTMSGAAMGGATSAVSFGLSAGVRDGAQANIDRFQKQYQLGKYSPDAQMKLTEKRIFGPIDEAHKNMRLQEAQAALKERQSTTLYRTVSEGERQSIEATGKYSVAPGGVEGKYFYPTEEQASTMARRSFPNYGPQTVTKVQVPNSLMNQATPISPYGEGPAFFVPTEQLENFPAPEGLNSILLGPP